MRAFQGLLVLCQLFEIAIGAAATATPEEQEGLDEVTVHGSHNELNRLRDRAIKLEDRFYARFNELNAIDDFDTYCHQEARAGTKLRRRYCRAVFQDKALLSEGQDYTDARFRAESQKYFPQPMVPPAPAYVAMLARMNEYQDNMRNVVSKDPELQELLRKRYEAEQKYYEVRRKAFGSEKASK